MQVSAQHQTERVGVQAVGMIVQLELRWLFREQPISDYGVDAHLEAVEAGHASGKLIAAQIKSGPWYFREPTAGGWVFRFNDDHADYWLNHSLPVIVVLYDEESQTAYWQAITSETVRSTGEEYKVVIPAAQRLDRRTRDSLIAFAHEPRPGGDPPADRQAAMLYRLPDQVSSRLKQVYSTLAGAGGQDQRPRAVRPAERLAELLVDGSSDPRATVADLLARPPKWLTESQVAADLWMAIAGYASDHNVADLAPQAFAKVLGSGATPAGRWRAFTGIALIDDNPEQARTVLDQAITEDGGALLASVGIAAIEAKGRQLRGPIPLPTAVEQALADPAQEPVLEPTVRLFIADQYLTAGDLTAAINALEKALAQLPGATSIQLKLAKALLTRVVQGLSPLRESDLYRARALAEIARADRRKWNGPSEEAAELLLQARSIAQDYPAALATALPAPDGEAFPRESRHPPLAAHAARIAIRLGDQRAAALEDSLTDEAIKTQLAALRAEANHASASHRRTAWRQALAAASDDQQRVLAIQALAMLGEQAKPELNLLETGTLPANDVEALQTIADAATMDPDMAIIQLRSFARTSLEATEHLAELLETNGRIDEAIDVWDHAAYRFDDHTARLAVLDILTRAGRHAEAATRMYRLLSRADLPPALRDRLRRGLIDQARQDWLTVEENAEQGLAESRSTSPAGPHVGERRLPAEAVDYAWMLVMARYSRRDIDRAAAALRELQPLVRDLAEANLWLRVVHLAGWTVDEARHAIDLANRFEEDPTFGGDVIIALTNVTTQMATGDDTPGDLPVAPLLLDEQTGQSLSQLIKRYHERHPDGPIRTIQPDPAVIADMVRARTPFNEHLDRLRDLVWLGRLPQGVFAQFARVPYMQLLLRRGASVLPACDPDPEHYDADLAAAHDARNHKIVVEPSAIAVATLLPRRWPTLLARFSAAVLPRVCYDDLLTAAHAVNVDIRAVTTLTADPATGQITMHTLGDEERRYLAQRLDAVRTAAQQLSLVEVADLRHASAAMTQDLPRETLDAHAAYDLTRDGAWMAPLEVALADHLAVWSDDFVLRRALRDLGVATFSTPALLHVLYETGGLPDTTEQDHAIFLAQYVVDLPRRPDLIIAQASADNWRINGGAIALARASWWWSGGTEPEDISQAINDYLRIARAVHAAAPHQLPTWFGVAARGFAALTTDEYRATEIARVAAVTIIEITGLTSQAIQALLLAAQAALAELARIADAAAQALHFEASPQLPPESGLLLANVLRAQLRGWLTTPTSHGGAGLSADQAVHVLDTAFADG